MAETEKSIRLSKVKGELNVSIDRIFEFLEEQGHKLDRNPNQKISEDQYRLLLKEFAQDREEKEESKLVGLNTRTRKESITLDEEVSKSTIRERERDQEEILIKDMNSPAGKSAEAAKEKTTKAKEEIVRAKPEKAVSVKVVSKIEIEEPKSKSKKKKGETEKEAEPEKKSSSKKKKEEPVEEPVVATETKPEVPTETIEETKEKPEEVIFRRTVEKL